MASDWPNNPTDVLRGLFGSLTSAAEQGGRDAATMWSALRSGAESWAAGVLNVTSPTPPTAEQIATQAQQLIGHVTIMDMNNAVQTVGQFLSAKQNLQNLSLTDQITGQSIFTPPWATTAGNPAVPDRYRIKVLRSITVHGFTNIERTEWATYELNTPLTNTLQALAQADDLFYTPGNSKGNTRGLVTVNAMLDYSIEQV